jgi:putative flippase GtrA
MAKYGGVAAGSTATDWALFSLVYLLAGNPLAAQVFSRIGGGLFSFSLNKFWSFDAGRTGHVTIQGRRFLLLYALSYMLSLGLLYLQINLLAQRPYISKLVADGACLVVNFTAMNLYVYRDRPGITTALRTLSVATIQNGKPPNSL